MGELLENNERILQAPAVALRNLTVLPGVIIHFDINRPKSVAAVEQAMANRQKLFLVAQRDPDISEPALADVYETGVLAEVRKVSKVSEGLFRVLVEGEARARLQRFLEEQEEYLLAEVLPCEEAEPALEEQELEAMLREIQGLCREYGQVNPKASKVLQELVNRERPFGKLLDEVAMSIPMDYRKRQEILDAQELKKRFEALSVTLANEIQVLTIRAKLGAEIKGKIEKNQKEYILREQLSYIRQELGEDNTLTDAEQYEQSLKKLKASREVKERIEKAIRRFKGLSSSTAESSVERTYIETLLELPWDKTTKDHTDLTGAEKLLEEQHYGLEDVKERVLEFLAVRSFTGKGASPVLCLVGPPGTGKTSIARSVADAMGRKFVRICLGGVRDEAEIRGHRRTYVGAMPGRIISGLRQAGVKNPVMLLDEIDKISADYRGDTSAALLEVLDTEQNIHFRDHYVEIPVDLSEVVFVATANSVSEIPRPLLDRMELIEISGYTANEKFHIAREHLVKKQFKKNGLSEKQLIISDSALKSMIQCYTREAGVRELERKIGELCRKTAKKLLTEAEKAAGEKKEGRNPAGEKAADRKAAGKKTSGQELKPVHITAGNLSHYLGVEKFPKEKEACRDEVGLARGLAWTSVGGETLQIEVNRMPGKGELELTGQMGDVMKESALAGLSYLRSVGAAYGLEPKFFEENDFHIHIPEGAVPKDGPSAGITMALALLSAATERKIRGNLAMTGEVTIRGRVLPVGGLKEKLLAAKQAGMKGVLVPAENRRDIKEIPKEILSGMEITYVDSMEQVIKQALLP